MKIEKAFRPGWKYGRNRKKHQGTLNKAVRMVNQNVANDNLWRGRFVVEQTFSSFYQYDGESAYELYVVLRFRDKKNGVTWEVGDTANSFVAFSGGKLFYLMNKFITEIDDVWQTEGRAALYSDLTDYTKIK